MGNGDLSYDDEMILPKETRTHEQRILAVLESSAATLLEIRDGQKETLEVLKVVGKSIISTEKSKARK